MCRSITTSTLESRSNVVIAKDSAPSGFLVKDNGKDLLASHHSSSERQKSSSSLRFNLDDLQVHHIPCRDDLSRDELVDMWYSQEDYLDMKRREKRIIKKVSRAANSNNSLGIIQQVLGIKTKSELIKRAKMIRYCQLLILTEQERLRQVVVSCQKKHQNASALILAEMYQGIAHHATYAARNRGLAVEVVLRNLDLIHDEPNYKDDVSSNWNTSSMRHRRWSAMGSSSDDTSRQATTRCCRRSFELYETTSKVSHHRCLNETSEDISTTLVLKHILYIFL